MNKWFITCKVFDNEEQNLKCAIIIKHIVDEFDVLISNSPVLGFKTLEIIRDNYSGPTLYRPLHADFYRIGLNVSEVNYCQIAFQFSQELCRIYCDPRINNWFIEILCHVMALHSLNFLSKNWKKNPPNNQLKDYWNNFDEYKSNLLKTAFSKVDMVRYQVANEWVQYQVDKLQQRSAMNRGKLLLIANELLPLFYESKQSWQILPFVGRSSVAPPPEDINQLVTKRRTKPDFDKFVKNVPKQTLDFVYKLCSKLGAREFV
ncbi:MAG: hypothetical protein MI739_14455 [Bacteroidales bacterium]|nr:hypothetical protein [Bacteroidales bacterium]